MRLQVLNPPDKIKPGAYFTLFLDVKTNNFFENEVVVRIALPKDWVVLAVKKPSVFKGQQNVKFMYTIAASALALTGSYKIRLIVMSDGYKAEVYRQAVEVEKVQFLEISTLYAPEYVVEGDTLKTEFMVQNLGNTDENFALKTIDGRIELPTLDSLKKNTPSPILGKPKKNTKKIEVKNQINSVTVEPNQSLRVRVVQIIPIYSKDSWGTTSTLQIVRKDSIVPISKTVSISVYPSKFKDADRYLRFPIEMSAAYGNYKFGNTGLSGYQFDIRGKGDLDSERKHYLNFIIHGPNQLNLPTLNAYDQYSFEYSYQKKTKIYVGDYTLHVNNLVEMTRFGKGIRFDQSFEKMDFSLFFVNPRFYPTQKDTYGGIFRFKPSAKFSLSLNLLTKILVDNKLQLFDAQFYGLSAVILSNNFSLHTEVSNSFAQGKTDFGVFNQLNWRLRRFQFNNNLIYAGKIFYGFYNDSYLMNNSLNYFLSKKLNINVTSNITQLNPSNDFIFFNASPYSQNSSIGLNYQVNKANRIFLSYDKREREDKSSLKRFHFTDNYGRISYSISTPNFSCLYEGRLGTAQNFLVKSDSSLNQRLIQHTIQPRVAVRPWLWVSGYFDYQRTSKFSADNGIRNLYFYGSSLKINFSTIFDASVNFRNNYAPDELTEIRSFLDINANLRLGDHELTFTGGKAFVPTIQINSQNNEFFSLKYSFKFNAPVARNKNLGNIKGKVIGLSDDINLKGIIAKLGNRHFVTDEKGSFQFNNLVPNKYFVNVVPSSIQSGVISTMLKPLEVIVTADTVQEAIISLTKTGTVMGKAIFQKSESPGTIDITKNKPEVLIKLNNGKESILTQLDSKDEFSFKGMKVGKWKLTVCILGQPDKFSILNAEQNIDLMSDAGEKITFTIAPKERKIRFSEKSHSLSYPQPERGETVPKSQSVVEPGNLDK